MKWRENMTPAEEIAFLAEIDAMDRGYAESDAWHQKQLALWLEWVNMVEGTVPEETDETWWDHYDRAALDHRGRP